MIDQDEPPGGVMSRHSRMLAGIFAALAGMLLAALVILAGQANRQRDAALARKQHSYEVMMLTSDLQGSLARSEAALGRYVIGKDPNTGAGYYEEWRLAGRQIDVLLKLVRDNPAQVDRARQIKALYARRDRELAPAATLILYNRQWNALSLFAQAGKSPVLPAMTRLLSATAGAERALLDQRATAAADTVDRSNLFGKLLSAVGVLLTLSAVAAGWLAMTAFAGRREATETAEAQIDRSAALEMAVADRTAELREANLRLLAEAAVRAETEEQLRQAHKMDAVGQLTGGIAHDFNNMLAVVIGSLDLARRRLRPGSEATRHLDNAAEGATRAAELTRRLLAFARAEPLLPVAISPAQLIEGMSDLIDRTIGERIEVDAACDAGLWPVWVDRMQLENALLNLCVNARDAMAGAGLLRISAANAVIGTGEIGELAAGDYVRLSVGDTGVGMSAEVRERVFEPFFTTKPIGQGTGLGLSQIFGFARQSGGDVTIDSIVGLGTTVSIYLPRHAGAIEAAQPAPAAALPTVAMAETILVVEDDPRVGTTTREALVELGYRPILCGSPEEALKTFAERRDIGLVVTDVMMPGMTGPELVERLLRQRPALRVLFVTGYVGEAGEAASFAGHGMLRKPFGIHALAAAVAAALGSEPDSLRAVA